MQSVDRVAANKPTNALAGQEETAPAPPHSDPLPPARSLAVNDWIPLQSWSETNHLSAPKRQGAASTLSYEVRTVSGVIALTAGSSLAHLNGLSYWLGYAPRSTNGELLVHTLDAQKNLLPLTRLSTLPTETRPVVVLDPGHGGDDPGARSARDARFEKDFALDWALRLRPLLEVRGWKVYLTRTNDIDRLLADRVALATELNASLFLSLHFNSTTRRDQSGLETYCLTPVGLPSTLTRDYEDDSALVFPNNTFDSQNLQYALRLHGALVEKTGGIDRGVRRARFMSVLRNQNRPAVLVEGGYLSNLREAELIGQPEYRQKLAEAVANALAFTHDAPVATNALSEAARVFQSSAWILPAAEPGQSFRGNLRAETWYLFSRSVPILGRSRVERGRDQVSCCPFGIETLLLPGTAAVRLERYESRQAGSKIRTSSTLHEPSEAPPGFGLRQSSGALAMEASRPKAPEDWRSPRRHRAIHGLMVPMRGTEVVEALNEACTCHCEVGANIVVSRSDTASLRRLRFMARMRGSKAERALPKPGGLP